MMDASSRKNIIFSPPQAGPSKQSPFKSIHQASNSPSSATFDSKLNLVPMPPPGGLKYSTDSMEKRQPVTSNASQRNMFSGLSDDAALDQENYPQSFHPVGPSYDGLARSTFALAGGLHGERQTKRKLLDSAPIHESRPFKHVKVEQSQSMEPEESLELEELPAPDSFPPLHDDGSKPPHSYAQLIGMSILRATNRRLTLAQIYKWISDTYSFYNAQEAGWQNSIRHNLSLNKAFIKQERPKDDPGKGNYWAIEPGMEHQFIKEKLPKKPAGPNETTPVLSTNPSPANLSETAQFKAPPAPAAKTPELPPSQPAQAVPETLPAIQELSSDATIPGSDACNTEPENDDATEVPSSPLIHSSPPMAAMHSSPPVARRTQKQNDTPPPVPRFSSSSRTRSRKRKYASMDDSGYFSSLDSSALRGPRRLLTSEAGRPIIKRGRAEEEIARLRGSSYDSPTKARALFAPASSSPMRLGATKKDYSQMLPPLTPAVKLKAPVRPPSSVSPNTNLKLHRDKVREMVGSPLRGMTTLDEHSAPWSPAFHLDDTNSMFQDFSTDYDIFTDGCSNAFAVSNGSPEKRSAKRPRLDRTRSANVLADISSSSPHKKLSSAPLLKFAPSLNNFGSPLKGRGFLDSPNKNLSPAKLLGLTSPSKIASPNFNLGAFDLPQDDLFDSEFLSEDVDEGWDIMQGFQKIGAASGTASMQAGKRSPRARPSLGRSFTSRF